MFNIFNKKKVEKVGKELKKFKYRIIFKNHSETKGIIVARDLDEIYEIMCTDTFQHMENNTKAYYWNKYEINTIEVELLKGAEEEV